MNSSLQTANISFLGNDTSRDTNISFYKRATVDWKEIYHKRKYTNYVDKYDGLKRFNQICNKSKKINLINNMKTQGSINYNLVNEYNDYRYDKSIITEVNNLVTNESYDEDDKVDDAYVFRMLHNKIEFEKSVKDNHKKPNRYRDSTPKPNPSFLFAMNTPVYNPGLNSKSIKFKNTLKKKVSSKKFGFSSIDKSSNYNNTIRFYNLKLKKFDYTGYQKDFKVLWIENKAKKTSFRTPEAREGGTINYFDGKIYLFGGLNNLLSNKLWEWDLLTQSWIVVENVSGDLPTGRYGHSAVVYYDNIILFAGSGGLSSSTRENMNDLKIFNISRRKWTRLHYTISNGYVSARKFHTACVQCNHMVVYGGVNEKGVILDELLILDLVKYSWTRAHDLIKSLIPLPARMHHTMVSVIPPELKNMPKLSIFNHPEIMTDMNQIRKLKLGIYIYGGLTSGPECDQICDNLYFIQTGKNYFTFEEIEGEGIGPGKRYMHSMDYDSSNNYLVLFGGKNDISAETFCSNEVFFFNLESLTWFISIQYGIAPEARYAHSSYCNDNTLYVFGGLGHNNYADSKMFVLKYDQNYVRNELTLNIQREKDVKKFIVKKIHTEFVLNYLDEIYPNNYSNTKTETIKNEDIKSIEAENTKETTNAFDYTNATIENDLETYY